MEKNSNSNKKIISPVVVMWASFLVNLDIIIYLQMFDGFYIFQVIYLFLLALLVSFALDILNPIIFDLALIFSFIYYIIIIIGVLNKFIYEAYESENANVFKLMIVINLLSPLPVFLLNKQIKRNIRNIHPPPLKPHKEGKTALNMNNGIFQLNPEINN